MKSLFIIILLSLAAISPAAAHAFLDHADPKVGSSVNVSPSTVKIWFTEELEGAFSKIKVVNANQHEVDRHDVKVEGALMTVSVPKLAPGKYEVSWVAVAVDTHRTTGSFSFTVIP